MTTRDHNDGVTCCDNDNGATELRRACDARSLARNFLKVALNF